MEKGGFSKTNAQGTIIKFILNNGAEASVIKTDKYQTPENKSDGYEGNRLGK